VRVDEPAYVRARDELMRHSDTRWSPWRTIDGNDDRAAAVAALEAVADAWAKAMPAEPPQQIMAARA
jgi:polyphosphate kinase 2 (PPK2 family)